jgi:hypothetical protein
MQPWRMHNISKLDDGDAISYDPLHMSKKNLTQPKSRKPDQVNSTQPLPHECRPNVFNSQMVSVMFFM